MIEDIEVILCLPLNLRIASHFCVCHHLEKDDSITQLHPTSLSGTQQRPIRRLIMLITKKNKGSLTRRLHQAVRPYCMVLWAILVMASIEQANVLACRSGGGRILGSVVADSADDIAGAIRGVSRGGSRSGSHSLTQLADDVSSIGYVADVSGSVSKSSSRSSLRGLGNSGKQGVSKSGKLALDAAESVEDILSTSNVDRAIWHAGTSRTSAGHKFRGIPDVPNSLGRLTLDEIDDILISTKNLRSVWHATELPGSIVYVNRALIKGFDPKSVNSAYDSALTTINTATRSTRSVDDTVESGWSKLGEWIASYNYWRGTHPKSSFLIDGLTVAGVVTVEEGALYGHRVGWIKAELVNVTRVLGAAMAREYEAEREIIRERQRDIYDSSLIAFTQIYIISKINRLFGLNIDLAKGVANSTYILESLRKVQEVESGQGPLTYGEFITLLGTSPTQLDKMAHTFAVSQANDVELVKKTEARLERLVREKKEKGTSEKQIRLEQDSLEKILGKGEKFDPSTDYSFEEYRARYWPKDQFQARWLDSLRNAPFLVDRSLLTAEDHASLIDPDGS